MPEILFQNNGVNGVLVYLFSYLSSLIIYIFFGVCLNSICFSDDFLNIVLACLNVYISKQDIVNVV